MIRWKGTHAFDQVRLADGKYLYLGNSKDARISWNGSSNRIDIEVPTISGTDPSRQIFASFTATGAVAAGKSLTGIQLSATFNGSGNNASVTAAEFKARHTTGNTATVVQLRGLVGNADAKNAAVTTAYAVEGSIDVSAGGTVTTSACFHGNLNNSGTVTTSYGVFVEGTSSVSLGIGFYCRYVTTDILLQNGATIVNGSASVLTITETTIALTGAVTVSGAFTLSGGLIVGANDEGGGQSIFYGDTSGSRMVWNDATDELYFIGTAAIKSVGTGSLSWPGDVGFNASLTVLGNCAFKGATVGIDHSITVNENAVVRGNIELTGTLRSVGAATLDSTLAIAGLITSNSTTGFRSLPTFVPDSTYTNYALAIGWKGSANELTVEFAEADDQNFNPIQLNVNVTGVGAGPTNSSQMNGIHQLITHDTNAMANLRLKCADWTISIGQNIRDAYIFQGQIDIAGDLTIGGEVCLSGLVMNASSGIITGSIIGQIIQMGGASLPSTGSYGLIVRTASTATLARGIYIEAQTGTTITDGISFGGAGTLTTGIRMPGTLTNAIIVGAQTICDGSGNLASANGANFGPADATSFTVVNGIVTAIS